MEFYLPLKSNEACITIVIPCVRGDACSRLQNISFIHYCTVYMSEKKKKKKKKRLRPGHNLHGMFQTLQAGKSIDVLPRSGPVPWWKWERQHNPLWSLCSVELTSAEPSHSYVNRPRYPTPSALFPPSIPPCRITMGELVRLALPLKFQAVCRTTTKMLKCWLKLYTARHLPKWHR